jgi:hypothetical protein
MMIAILKALLILSEIQRKRPDFFKNQAEKAKPEF